MIEITIKTLDSRNHEFSVEDDLTVKQLKEQIAESVGVAAESQRLIYCGRVLLDDKKLSEYDVNGKVIHLVQRAPPSSSGGVSSSTSGSSTSGRSGERGGSRARLDNAMYLGAMAFPADLMDAQGLTVPPARHTLSHSRLGVARAMLQRANNVLQSLEGRSDPPADPTPSSDPTTPAESSTPAEPSQDNDIQAEVTVPSEPSPATGPNEPRLRPSDFAAAATAAADAVTAALDHAFSVHHGGNVSITLNNTDGNGPDDLVVRVIQGSSNEPSSAAPSGGNGTSRPRPAAQRTTALADLVSQLREVQSRMEPYLDRYYNLMHNDPPDVTESQQVFNQVSELMHLLAHAYHALSDIMCDLSQAPPRVLRCRPVLIQHSAVLQTGIPIQVPVPAGAQIINLSPQPNNTNQMESGSQTEGQNNSNQSQPRAEESATSETTPSHPESQPQSTRRPVEEMLLNGLRPDRPSGAERSGPTATVSISPSNLEIFMDVSSGSISFDSLEATVLHASAPSSSTNNPPAAEQSNQSNSSGDHSLWGQPPPNDFIQSLFQRIYGEMSNIHNNNYNNINNNSRNNSSDSGNTGSGSSSNSRPQTAAAASSMANAANTSSNSTSTASAEREGGDTPSSQRENTGPSSGSTSMPNIRSFSSRPHIHIGPGPHIQAVDFFDPFLPCNSHHIRGRRRGAGSTNTSNTSDTNQQQSTDSGVPGSDSSTSESSGPPHPTVQMTLLPSGASRVIRRRVIPYLPRELLRTLQQTSAGAGSISRTTIAQLLEALPGQPYTPGQSLILDFFMTAGRSIMLQDVVGEANPAMLGWMRPGLCDYLENTLGVGPTCPEAAIQTAVDRINNELTPFFDSPFEGLTMREDVDLPASIRKVLQTYLPQLIKDIHQADNFTYSVNISQHVLKLIHGVINVLAFASNTPRANLETVISAFACKLVNCNTEEVTRTWLIGELAIRLRQVIRPFDFVRESYRTFIVNVPPPQGNNSQPMEIDGVEEASSPELSPLRDRESLPQVIIGSEPWHHDLPPDWVPIITRDRERQRRGANQGPLSDAYLAGMPSKRRKLLTDAKPNTSLNKVISESMGRALGAAGLAPTAAAELVEAAACDSGLRNAYKAQVRSSVETTLRSHPDYHPEKYPNTAKYFNRLHR